MDGLLIIDKPEGLTSHDVVARVRRALKTKRVGHTGTLDPFATGILVMLIGKATRLAQFLDKDEKEYEAVIQFGYETDTGDRTGMRTVKSGMQNEEIVELLRTTKWETVFDNFRGEIEQVPPMYSAKKQDGKKLYELARQGKEVERKPVQVTINELELIGEEQIRAPHSTLRIRVVCSAGTYIRTLAEDIGRRIGVGAHLAELRRSRAGKFTIDQSIWLDTLDLSTINLIPVEDAVSHLSPFVLSDERVEKTRNGLTTRTNGTAYLENEFVRMLDKNDNLIAVGIHESELSEIRPKILLI
jgi:tRNA pseudouridine55 synthase